MRAIRDTAGLDQTPITSAATRQLREPAVSSGEVLQVALRGTRERPSLSSAGSACRSYARGRGRASAGGPLSRSGSTARGRRLLCVAGCLVVAGLTNSGLVY